MIDEDQIRELMAEVGLDIRSQGGGEEAFRRWFAARGVDFDGLGRVTQEVARNVTVDDELAADVLFVAALCVGWMLCVIALERSEP